MSIKKETEKNFEQRSRIAAKVLKKAQVVIKKLK